jgi:hypothetical protein
MKLNKNLFWILIIVLIIFGAIIIRPKNNLDQDKTPPLQISRTTSSYVGRQVMVLTVTSPVDWEGKFEDLIPEKSDVVWQGPGKIANGKIIWEAKFSAGTPKEFKYEYVKIN